MQRAKIGTVVKIVQGPNGRYPIDQNGNEVSGVPEYTIQSAWDEDVALEFMGSRWRKRPLSVYYAETPSDPVEEVVTHAQPILDEVDYSLVEIPEQHLEIVNFIHSSYKLRPKLFKISEINWKFAIRSVIRGDNLLILGESGFGKTMFANIIKDVFGRPFFTFNLGATQDPRTTLIGTKHYAPDKGTYVVESLFAKAIQTPDAIILLDEVSRAHPDAHNILMSVLDRKQRYLRLDEHPDSPTIQVAEGVSFIGTANVGVRYTATRVMDDAFIERWKLLVMPFLSHTQEVELLQELYPSMDPYYVTAIADIANTTREEMKSDNPQIDRALSTRATTEIAELLYDGFTLEEAAEVKIYPFFSDVGGAESPQAFMRRLVQKYIITDAESGTIDPFDGMDPNAGKTPVI